MIVNPWLRGAIANSHQRFEQRWGKLEAGFRILTSAITSGAGLRKSIIRIPPVSLLPVPENLTSDFTIITYLRVLPNSAQYNGNISAMVWNTPPEGGIHFPEGKRGYGLSYDGLNRLKSSVYGEGTGFSSNRNAYNERLTYDLNGNIMSLSRQKKGTGVIDSLAYTYKNGGNILDRVDDAITGVNGFSELVKQAGEYGYDGNGNLISDANKGIDTIKYNFLNSPEKITGGTDHISCIYDAIGTKLARIKTTGDTVYYAGNFVYNGSSLNYILNQEGMYLPTGVTITT